jgi:transcriptional regulator with XRE-family HTH domain
MQINGTTLRRLRVASGLTQTDLSRSTGIPRTSIVRLESGEYHGTPAHIKALCDHLGVGIDELCNDEAAA